MERATWEASSLIRARMEVQHALDECCAGLGSPTLSRVPSRIEVNLRAAQGGLGQLQALQTLHTAGRDSPGGVGKRSRVSPARERPAS